MKAIGCKAEDEGGGWRRRGCRRRTDVPTRRGACAPPPEAGLAGGSGWQGERGWSRHKVPAVRAKFVAARQTPSRSRGTGEPRTIGAKTGLSGEIRRNPTIEFLTIMKRSGCLKMNIWLQDAARIPRRCEARCLRYGGGRHPGKALEIKVRQALSGFVRLFFIKKICRVPPKT